MSLAKSSVFIRSDSSASRSSSASPRCYLDCRTLGSAGSSWRCRWASTLSSASSRGPRIPTSTTWPVAGCPRSSTAWPPAPTGCRQRRSSRWPARSPLRDSPGSPTSWAGRGATSCWPFFLGPYLRQFGAYTIPDFLGARYGGNFARDHRRRRRHRLLLHLPDRPGDGRRPDRGPLSSGSTSTSVCSWA